MAKCKNCINLHNHWCDMVVDSPDENAERECCTYERMKNADKIRAMSDEELAKENIYFVSALNAKEGLHYTGLDGHYYRTSEEVAEANMKWLQSEVE